MGDFYLVIAGLLAVILVLLVQEIKRQRRRELADAWEMGRTSATEDKPNAPK